MDLKPFAWIAAKTEATTGGLFQLPSVGTASSVFPKFQPGFSCAKAADAVIGVKVPVHFAPEVPVALVAVDVALLTTVVDVEILLTTVVDDDTTVVLAVPGMHWK